MHWPRWLGLGLVKREIGFLVELGGRGAHAGGVGKAGRCADREFQEVHRVGAGDRFYGGCCQDVRLSASVIASGQNGDELIAPDASESDALKVDVPGAVDDGAQQLSYSPSLGQYLA
jgi:hypothetical protein